MSTPPHAIDTFLPGFSFFFLGDDLTKLCVVTLYRGDERTPQEIFAKGFKAPGGHSSIIGHICNNDGNFVSTSYDSRVAKRFPVAPNSDIIYLYEINALEKAVNVNELLKPAEKAGKLKTGGAKYFAAECEIVVPRSIKPRDIKGAWTVELTHVVEHLFGKEATSRITEMRTVKSYVPNPEYVPTSFEHFLPSTGLLVTRLAINGLSTVGLAIDAYSLYSLFKFGEKTGNYNPFLREGARITGGLTGAINLGAMFARYGAAVGKTFGPYGLAVGGLVAGTAGSIIGYCGGGRLTTAFFDSDRSVALATLIFDSIKHRREKARPRVSKRVFGAGLIDIKVPQTLSDRISAVVSKLPPLGDVVELGGVGTAVATTLASKSAMTIRGRRLASKVLVPVDSTASTIFTRAQAVASSPIPSELRISPLTCDAVFESANTALSTRAVPAVVRSLGRESSPAVAVLAQEIGQPQMLAHTQQLLQAARASAAVPHVPSALEALGYSRSTIPSASSPAIASAVLFAHRPSLASAIATRTHPAAAVPSTLSTIGMGPYTMSQAATTFSAPRDTHAARLFSRAEFHSAKHR